MKAFDWCVYGEVTVGVLAKHHFNFKQTEGFFPQGKRELFEAAQRVPK